MDEAVFLSLSQNRYTETRRIQDEGTVLNLEIHLILWRKKKSFLLEFNQTWYKANVTIKQIRILNVRCCNVPNVVKSAQLKAVPTEQNIKHTG